MSDTESFESVMSTLLDGFIHNVLTNQLRGPYDMIAANIERLRRAHDREMRDTAQQEYHRGFNDGRHSMDAEHRAVAMRLRALPLDGGSHENLSQIARAVYHSDWGWTKGACESLRDNLIDLMGGVSDDIYKNGDSCETGGADDTCDSQCRGACADCDGRDSGEQTEVSVGGCEWLRDGTTSDSLIPVLPRDEKQEEVDDGRAAHDCAADSRGGSRGELVHMDGVTYDVLDNERRKALCKLRKLSERGNVWGRELIVALGLPVNANNDDMCDRLIHLLGGDRPSGIDVMNSYEQRIEKLESQRDEARDERDELMKQRAEMTAELARRLKERDELQEKYAELSAELSHQRTRMERACGAVYSAERERDELQAKLNAIRDALDG